MIEHTLLGSSSDLADIYSRASTAEQHIHVHQETEDLRLLPAGWASALAWTTAPGFETADGIVTGVLRSSGKPAAPGIL